MAPSVLCTVALGGVRFRLRFCDPVTILYFQQFQAPDGPTDYPETVAVDPEELARRQPDFGSRPFAEYNLLMDRLAALLPRYGRGLFHGVALAVGQRAWLLTAPSGTGKTTQYRLWKQLYGDGVRLICGDKPILEFAPGGVTVHPSPWMGKERFPGGAPAPLAGTVYLEQGDHNAIAPLPTERAVVPLYTQFLLRPETAEDLHRTARQLEQLLTAAPVWKLVNLGDPDSARLTHDTLCGEETI